MISITHHHHHHHLSQSCSLQNAFINSFLKCWCHLFYNSIFFIEKRKVNNVVYIICSKAAVLQRAISKWILYSYISEVFIFKDDVSHSQFDGSCCCLLFVVVAVCSSYFFGVTPQRFFVCQIAVCGCIQKVYLLLMRDLRETFSLHITYCRIAFMRWQSWFDLI